MCLQVLAADCIKLLRAIADTLSDFPGRVAWTEQQQQWAEMRQMFTELPEASAWLSAAVGTLLLCLQHASIYHVVDWRQVLGISGQLAEQVTVTLFPWPLPTVA